MGTCHDLFVSQHLPLQGIKELNDYRAGDQLIHINVWTPKKLNKEEKALLEKLKVSENFIPSPSKGEKSFFDKVRDLFD